MGRLPPGRRGLKHRIVELDTRIAASPSPRKAWIETRPDLWEYEFIPGRLPPGRRGLKLSRVMVRAVIFGRLPPGRRGLKRKERQRDAAICARRLPPGRRGLKPHRAPVAAQRGGVAFPPEGVD